MSGLRDFLDAITSGSFMADASEGSHNKRFEAEIYTELSLVVNNLMGDEDEDSSGEDNQREINLPPERAHIAVNRELLHSGNGMGNVNRQESSPDCLSNDEGSTNQQPSVESDNNANRELLHSGNGIGNVNRQESSPDCLSNDEGFTNQQPSVESDNNEDVGELPHRENQMENEHIQGSPPNCSANDKVSTSQRANVEDNERKRKLPCESDDNDREGELPHGGNKRKRKLPSESENNFIQGSFTGCWDNNGNFRRQQVSAEDSEREKKLPHKSHANEHVEEIPHGNNESKENSPPK
ncbi:uncharacterized protein LOC125035432 isoform X3 [Penaeus chinensis]|uniref:uncharacterized protein LOC125035432 isoform X3 n=1 Tax=Penaeus chinensis TaxID=139456 RepID=UPI001FB7FAE2|nr:uncharacterized protein LOC125035432 isoform X3 [Penaeus chinensis]XP_047483779.1 uncharacterized protein LOC125035432 isoform X3 [Penaeus chinensis]XP_047483780.1 uncharacterized protein LOC125035432 isoform X3 [Penaeus chinensis]XP_047483781.1 uncharacterized protein LOC125035432 isoform X3 [Penaeus chinensis]XP_047483782.1 uncharacterized protein LOC125035432 isoform X3 [Penaeus chinensis]XP_047483783.1 uncharacterized protein LOC125035432 isoform X3 [Penaeus chinensis]XP_047483784.1 un